MHEMGQDNSSLPKGECPNASLSGSPPPFFSSSRSPKSSPAHKSDSSSEQLNSLTASARKRGSFRDISVNDVQPGISNVVKSLNEIGTDLVSDDHEPDILLKHEVRESASSESLYLAPTQSLQDHAPASLLEESIDDEHKVIIPAGPTLTPELSCLRSPTKFKPDQSPEIIPHSQVLSMIKDIPRYSPGPNLRSPGDDTNANLSHYSLDSVASYAGSDQPNNTPSQPRKLKSVSSGWSRRFVESQRSPPRRVARRKVRAKQPLILPKISGGRKFKSMYTPTDYKRQRPSLFGIESKSQAPESQFWSNSAKGLSSGGGNIPGFDYWMGSNESGNNTQISRLIPSTITSGELYHWDQKSEKPNFLKPHTELIHIQLGSAEFRVYADFLFWHCPLLAEEYRYGKPVLPKFLEDVDVNVFGLFVNWLYTEKVVNKRGQPPFQHRSMGLWVLANRLGMPILANNALDALEARRRQENDIQAKAFAYVYSHTKEGDGLRRYIVDICILVFPSFSEETRADHFPEELKQDIFVASLTSQIKNEDGEVDTTRYHFTVEQ